MLPGETIDIACYGKQKFSSWTKAAFAMKKTAHSQHNTHDKRKIAIYHCKSCNGLHIGGSDHPNKKK